MSVRMGTISALKLLLAASSFACAADLQSTILVEDITGAIIQRAKIELQSSQGNISVSTITDSMGRAEVPCRAGSVVRAQAPGFEPQSAILQDCSAGVRFRLSPASLQTRIEVVVTDAGETNLLPTSTVNSASAAQIDRTAARTVFDAVEDLSPGVYVTRRGAMGYGISTNGTGAVNIRGVGGSPNTDVLVVTDGRPDFQGEMGHPLPDFYSLSDVGSISVTEGPGSVLYGSNAMGGVIEIRPREPGEGPEFQLTSSLGSYLTGLDRLWAGMRQGKWLYTFSAGINHTNGDRPMSHFRSQDGSLGVGYQASSVWKMSLDASYGHFLTEDPGSIYASYGTPAQPGPYASVGRGGFTLDLDNATSLLSGYTRFYSTRGRNFISDGFRSTDALTGGRIFQNLSVSSKLAVDFGMDAMNYGGLAQQMGAGATNYGGSHEMTDAAGFVRIHWSPTAQLLFNAGLRYQTDTMFGDITLPEFGVAWFTSDRISLSGSVSRGFRNPTIRELYLFPAPNPDLQPEDLWNYQATLKARVTAAASAWVTFFYADCGNQILTLGQYPNMQLLNGGKAMNKGVEANFRWAFSRLFSVNAGYAYLTSTNLAPLVPKNKATFAVNADLKRAVLNVRLQAIGQRNTDSFPTQLGRYTLASAKVSFPLRKSFDVFATVDNIFNQDYQVFTGYPMPAVNAAGGFTVHF